MEHRDRVVEVGEPVHPRQPRLRAAQERLHAVAGALRLGPERPVGLPPRRHVRQLVHRPLAQRLAGRGFGRLQQRVAVLVTRTRHQPVDGQQQGAVVGPQREHRVINMGVRPGISVEQANVSHDVPPTRDPAPTPGSKTARENLAGRVPGLA